MESTSQISCPFEDIKSLSKVKERLFEMYFFIPLKLQNLITMFMFSLQGVRSSNVDACAHSNPCKNGGECLPTDQGPVCDCNKIDFQGLFCQEGNTDPFKMITLLLV